MLNSHNRHLPTSQLATGSHFVGDFINSRNGVVPPCFPRLSSNPNAIARQFRGMMVAFYVILTELNNTR